MNLAPILASVEASRVALSQPASAWNPFAQRRRVRQLQRLDELLDDITRYSALRSAAHVFPDLRSELRLAVLEDRIVSASTWLRPVDPITESTNETFSGRVTI